jgi:uncharacterized membrane protein YphA (DoxX/SURF4 family)
MAGSSIAPIFLRTALAVTFLWAGFGRLLDTVQVKGADAAMLANMGVISPDAPSTPAASSNTSEQPAAAKSAPGSSTPRAANPTVPVEPAEPAGKTFTASDFAKPAAVRRMHMLSLMIARGAAPLNDEHGNARIALLPSKVASGSWPVIVATTITSISLICGLFVLVGLLTRVSAISLALVVVSEIWLMHIGPAIQDGSAHFGFLPNYTAFGVDAAGNFLFAPLLWQFSLWCCCMALAFTGPGRMSFDRALFPSRAISKKQNDELD